MATTSDISERQLVMLRRWEANVRALHEASAMYFYRSLWTQMRRYGSNCNDFMAYVDSTAGVTPERSRSTSPAAANPRARQPSPPKDVSAIPEPPTRRRLEDDLMSASPSSSPQNHPSPTAKSAAAAALPPPVDHLQSFSTGRVEISLSRSRDPSPEELAATARPSGSKSADVFVVKPDSALAEQDESYLDASLSSGADPEDNLGASSPLNDSPEEALGSPPPPTPPRYARSVLTPPKAVSTVPSVGGGEKLSAQKPPMSPTPRGSAVSAVEDTGSDDGISYDTASTSWLLADAQLAELAKSREAKAAKRSSVPTSLASSAPSMKQAPPNRLREAPPSGLSSVREQHATDALDLPQASAAAPDIVAAAAGASTTDPEALNDRIAMLEKMLKLKGVSV